MVCCGPHLKRVDYLFVCFSRRYGPARHKSRRFCLYLVYREQDHQYKRFHLSCHICYDTPRACSPDVHACFAKVAEIRWKRCVPGSQLAIARLRETIMLQMMYLRMTDTKSAAREGEGVYICLLSLFGRSIVPVVQT